MDQFKKDNNELEDMPAKEFLQDSIFGKGAVDQFFVLCRLKLNDPYEWSRALLRERFDLTKQETKTLAGLCMGLTQERIAENMGKSDRTIRNIIQSILNKMNARSISQACAEAGKYGFPYEKRKLKKELEKTFPD